MIVHHAFMKYSYVISLKERLAHTTTIQASMILPHSSQRSETILYRSDIRILKTMTILNTITTY